MISQAWEVFLLFLIPVGGGIPAGVLLAQKHGLTWPVMVFLYFISDAVLACAFEPILLLFLKVSKSSPKLARFRETLAKSTQKTVANYGLNPGPFALIMITFGTDPMTGRAVTRAAGHGFIPGWTLAIIGDMIFFLVLMISTLWLNSVLGDGTWTAIIIMVAMIGIPALIRKLKF